MVNQALKALGINGPKWLTDPSFMMLGVIIVGVWSSVGYNMIILLAGLKNIPRGYYEAAMIDGATSGQQFRKITVPLLSPVLFFVSITSLMGGFKVFDIIIAMTQGGPGRATNVLAYFVYNKSFMDSRFGYASAAAFVMFAIIMVFTAIQFIGQKKWVNY